MNLNFTQPLSNGFMRMKKALFQPFELSKWINIGFTAFLAGLTDCHGGGNGNSGYKGRNQFDWDEFFSFPQIAWDWLISHQLWFSLIIAGVIFLVIFTIVICWIGSRGKFMFLYNVANEKDEVVLPWKEFCKEGNSLFWWRFIYGWIVLIIFVLYITYSFGILKNIHYEVIPPVAKVGFITGMILTFLALIVITGYISLFLNDFVVPIMYKNRISAIKAWSKFTTLAVHNMGSFFIYGLFVFALTIAVVIGVVIAAIMTCCIGFLLIIIPFIGAVVLLPISYTFRAFSIEYLSTFGDQYNVFPENTDAQTEQ